MRVATDGFPATYAAVRWRAASWPALRAVVWSRALVWLSGVLAVLLAGVSQRAGDFDPTRLL